MIQFMIKKIGGLANNHLSLNSVESTVLEARLHYEEQRSYSFQT